MNRFSFLGSLSANNEAGSPSRGMKPAVLQADESELLKPRFIILPHCPTKNSLSHTSSVRAVFMDRQERLSPHFGDRPGKRQGLLPEGNGVDAEIVNFEGPARFDQVNVEGSLTFLVAGRNGIVHELLFGLVGQRNVTDTGEFGGF